MGAGHWRLARLVPDRCHAFSFNYTGCFTAAVHHERAYGWPPNAAAIEAAEREMKQRGAWWRGTALLLSVPMLLEALGFSRPWRTLMDWSPCSESQSGRR